MDRETKYTILIMIVKRIKELEMLVGFEAAIHELKCLHDKILNNE